jgi:hypothetical protein
MIQETAKKACIKEMSALGAAFIPVTRGNHPGCPAMQNCGPVLYGTVDLYVSRRLRGEMPN